MVRTTTALTVVFTKEYMSSFAFLD
jgi:hypothetical protein